jgi:superfamily II DNA or RNA helicase
MKFAVGNVYTEVLQCTNKEDSFLNATLSVSVPNHQFMPAFKKKQWDGRKVFYSSAYKTFPTGFLPFILEECIRESIPLEVVDNRHVPPLHDPTSLRERYKHLREYQIHGLIQALTHTITVGNVVLPWQRGVLKFPTGAGKTIMAASLIDFIHKKTLYVVERRELLYQTQDSFKTQTQMSLGILGDNKEELNADITFAMAQTVRSKFAKLSKFLKGIEVLVIDEVQHLSKGVYHKIAIKCPSPFRFGFSATPLRRGDLGDVYLIADTGEVIAEGDREEIQNQGFLAKPKVYMFTVDKPVVGNITYKMAYKGLIVDNDHRNDMIVSVVKKLRQRNCAILILVRQIDHGATLQRMIKKAKIPCLFIKGEDAMDVRKLAKEEIGKSYHVLISTGIFDEGVDMPLLDAGIMAGGGNSRIKSIQRVGRILRPKNDGKNEVYIVDFKDTTNKYLFRHSSERLSAYEDEGFAIQFPKQV